LETGKRGKRSSRLEKLLNVLSGAEASLAVNNNAAAVVLAVNCFALNKEVIVSRGELIEIGGSFRLPDVIEAAGGRLREVGTTNKTRLSDFERAIGPDTGLVMRCHRSNFEIRGFTEETELRDLAELCRRKNIPLVEDLGSGVLLELSECGLADEPTLEESLSTGCDLVTFSGDKLLGGPQAGIIAGRKELVDRLAKHPLYRALRLDKISISLLEQALCAYVTSNVRSELPALSLISASEAELAERVTRFCKKTEPALRLLVLEMVATESAIGGGSLPGKVKASQGIILKAPLKANQLAQLMRTLQPPVIVLTKDDDCIIDFRTVLPADEELLFSALVELESKLN
jgi:L-seryl-tRNA(Ser) seleniumtransferase